MDLSLHAAIIVKRKRRNGGLKSMRKGDTMDNFGNFTEDIWIQDHPICMVILVTLFGLGIVVYIMLKLKLFQPPYNY